MFSNNNKSLRCKVMENTALTLHLVFNLALGCIFKINEPSASENPVINQGFILTLEALSVLRVNLDFLKNNRLAGHTPVQPASSFMLFLYICFLDLLKTKVEKQLFIVFFGNVQQETNLTEYSLSEALEYFFSYSTRVHLKVIPLLFVVSTQLPSTRFAFTITK